MVAGCCSIRGLGDARRWSRVWSCAGHVEDAKTFAAGKRGLENVESNMIIIPRLGRDCRSKVKICKDSLLIGDWEDDIKN